MNELATKWGIIVVKWVKTSGMREDGSVSSKQSRYFLKFGIWLRYYSHLHCSLIAKNYSQLPLCFKELTIYTLYSISYQFINFLAGYSCFCYLSNGLSKF